jgi:hypothetical protein
MVRPPCPRLRQERRGREEEGDDERVLTIPAKLAISIARKMNALIFLVPEGEFM